MYPATTNKLGVFKMFQESTTKNNYESESNERQMSSIGEIYKNILRDYPDILDVGQVSAILGVSSKTVYRLLNEGSLASLKVGRAFKIPKLYLLQYIKVISA
jgi:excisionase family DNA binding protein